MNSELSALLAVLSLLLYTSSAENILFFFQLSTYSHQITAWPLIEGLAERGHNVTFHSIHSPKSSSSSPNIREFLPLSFKEKVEARMAENVNFLGNYLQTRIEQGRIGTQRVALGLPAAGFQLCEQFLNSPEVDLFLKTEKFDLLVIDALFNECGYGIAQRFGAKTIVFSTSHPFSWGQEPFGVIAESSHISELHVSFQTPMTFFQRVFSTLFIPGIYYWKTVFYYPKLDALFETKFGPSMRSIKELERETSLILYNSYFSEEMARPLPPMYVPVGGMHCDWGDRKTKAKSIPKDIENFIKDAGDEGFIFVSFGSEAKVRETSPEFQNIFYTVFAKSKIHFLWKWEGPRPKEMPPNVFTAEWMPQQQILASKNCKAFLTHGGLLSIQEAISYGVPMIALPIFAEQDYNSFRIERLRRGIRLEASTLTVDHLQHAIHQILTNPLYKENVEQARSLFMDRPQKPLETAIYWTEFVLRHKDTSSLKPIYAMEQYWFQRRLLDVWEFIFASLATTIFLFYYVTKKMFSYIFYRSLKVEKHKATKKLKRS